MNLRRISIAIQAATLATLVHASDARAAAFDLADTTWEGCSELLDIARTELGDGRVRIVAVMDWSEVTPEDGVLVLHPLQAMDPDETAAFMRAGGRLAILDDYGRGNETLERFRIERASPPAQPVSALRNKPSLAIAEPVSDVVAGHATGPHPVVADVQRLVTNHPTALHHPNLSPVLKIRAIGEPDAIIAVAGQVGRGRLFAMSDPSAVMNMMLRYPGNRAFARGLSRYLVDDDPAGKRGGRLFIVANRFKEEGAFGGDETLRKTLEGSLRSLGDAIADARRDGFPPWFEITAAALVLLGVAAWIASASARPYRSPLPRYARRTPLVSQGGVAGRFALLAAPSSPRALTLLELRSALFEALTHRFELASEPTAEGLSELLRGSGKLAPTEQVALDEVLASMKRVESAVILGSPGNVPAAALERAAAVVRAVLSACEAPHAIMPLVSGSPLGKNGADSPPPDLGTAAESDSGTSPP